IDEDVEINLEEAQAKLYRIDLEHPKNVLSMQDVNDEEPADVEEVLEVVKAPKLMTEVVTTTGATTTAEATKVSVPKRRRDIDEDVEINLEEAQAKLYRIDLEHPKNVLSMQDVNDEEPGDVEEVLEVVKAPKLMTEVVTTGATTTAEATKVSVPRRRRGFVIQDPEETTSTVIVHSEVQSKDKGKGIFIEEPKSLKGQAQIEQDEAFAR
nr:hypothetical protein [Tanacetum cinerariifolium]